MPESTPTYGFRTLKGSGSRLLRDVDDDWVNVQAKEGYSGWKKGLLFLRTYSYLPKGVNGAQNLYRIDALRLGGLDLVATGFGPRTGDAWFALYDDLKRKGVMPLSDKE